MPAWGPELWGAVHGARVRPGEVVAARCLMGTSDPPADVSWTVNGEAVSPEAAVARPVARGPRGRLGQGSVSVSVSVYVQGGGSLNLYYTCILT